MEDNEECDVCQGAANLVCGNCHQAVYCGQQCQSLDYAQHVEFCIHPRHLDEEDMLDAIDAHLDHADLTTEQLEHVVHLLENDLDTREWIASVIYEEYDLVGAKPRKPKLNKTQRARKLQQKRVNKNIRSKKRQQKAAKNKPKRDALVAKAKNLIKTGGQKIKAGAQKVKAGGQKVVGAIKRNPKLAKAAALTAGGGALLAVTNQIDDD